MIFPVLVVLQGLSQIRDLEDNGRNWLSTDMRDYVFIVPKANGWDEAAVLAQGEREAKAAYARAGDDDGRITHRSRGAGVSKRRFWTI